MMVNFWKKLPKPFLALAPMEDVTDSVFRRIIISLDSDGPYFAEASKGRPHVCFTEFVNVDGVVNLCDSDFEKILFGSTPRTVPSKIFSENPASLGRKEFMKRNGLLQRLYFTEGERPLVAQIWGNKPENFYKAAQIIAKLGFDGVDINMGCPQRKVMKTGGCAALIGQNNLVKEIIQATKEGSGALPVSVKTRIGIKKVITEDWIGFLLEQGLDAITVHGRTVTEQSKVPTHWDEIGKVVKMRNSLPATSGTLPLIKGRGGRVVIIGNGDVKDYADAMEKVKEYGVDGVMIARGIFQNPFAFKHQDTNTKIQIERIELFKKHIELYRETWGKKKSFFILRKFVKMYINGWEGAVAQRELVMQAENYEQLLHNIQQICPPSTR